MEKKLTIAQIRSKIKTALPEVVKEFDRIHGKYYRGYEEELYEFLQKPATIKLWGEVFKKEIDTAIEELIQKQMDRNDFVDFSDTVLRKRIRMLLTRIRKESPSIEAKIRIQMDVIERFNNLDSFYGNDKLDKIVEAIIKDFTKIFQEGDEPTRRILFTTVRDYLNPFEDRNATIAPLEKFLVESFYELDQYYEDLSNYLNTKIDRISSSDSLSDSLKDYYISLYAITMLNILTKKNAVEGDWLNYAKKYWANKYIRQWLINYYRRNEQLDKAISLLEESIVLDKEIPKLVENYKSYMSELKELYKQSSISDKHKA